MVARALTTSRYEALTKIAAGGMATVFVGRARGAVGFTRLVALKRPHPFVASDAALRSQLEREARAASLIHHPHVVSVLDVEVIDDEMVLVLDYIEGTTLAELGGPKRRPGFAPIAARILLDAAEGLHAAHGTCDAGGRRLGIVHRDVSPQNILVGLDGMSRLTDFGIAKLDDGAEHTATEVIKGKLAYLAPEYLERRAFDARSDQFALGIVAWEALAGERLFRGANDLETMRRILEGKPAALAERASDLAAFDPILARALARDPADRWPTVRDFAGALEDCARRQGLLAAHADVGAAVDAAVGERLRARRETIAHASPKPMLELSHVRSARDAQLTLPLGVAAPEPRRRLPWLALGAVVLATGATAGALAFRPGRRTSPVTPASSPPPPPASAAALLDTPASVSTPRPTSPPAPVVTEPPAPRPSSHGHAHRHGHAPPTPTVESPLPTVAPRNPYH